MLRRRMSTRARRKALAYLARLKWELFLREPLWVKACDCKNGCEHCRVELPEKHH